MKVYPAFVKLMFSSLYGNGATGVCGRLTTSLPGFSVRGMGKPFWVYVPLISPFSIFPSNVAPIIATETFIVPSSLIVFSAAIPLAPCEGESMVQPSPEKLNTKGNLVPIMFSSPFHAPSCALAASEASAINTVVMILVAFIIVFINCMY